MTILPLTLRGLSPIVEERLKDHEQWISIARDLCSFCSFCCLGRLPEGNRHTLQWIVGRCNRENFPKQSLLMAAQEA
jgi:hypothetical protein